MLYPSSAGGYSFIRNARLALTHHYVGMRENRAFSESCCPPRCDGLAFLTKRVTLLAPVLLWYFRENVLDAGARNIGGRVAARTSDWARSVPVAPHRQ